MDDIERAVDDGVNTFKALTRDDLFVPSRYPALERYAELQVLTYMYQCHSTFEFKVVKAW